MHIKHRLARAEGLALILVLTSVFIQRLWIQVNFLCSIFIAVLLVSTWNNEYFVHRVKGLSRCTPSPASLSIPVGFKQFILISRFCALLEEVWVLPKSSATRAGSSCHQQWIGVVTALPRVTVLLPP